MNQIAQVIVDVPVMQTNSPYSYLIPDHLNNQIKEGMRVVVPFGKGTRLVQAFVITVRNHLTKKEKENYTNLKEVDSLMDIEPVLNNELLALGKWMADTTFSFQINCYQTMLPSVYRAKYHKIIRLLDTQDDQLTFELFNGKDYIDFEEVKKKNMTKQMVELRSQEKVQVEYLVSDQTKIKQKRIIFCRLTTAEYLKIKAKLSKRAYKQEELLDFLISTQAKEIEWEKLRDDFNISSQVLNKAIEKGWVGERYEEVYRNPYDDNEITSTSKLPLTDEQDNALQEIIKIQEDNRHEVFLLQGITGSGKTEVYLQSIGKVLAKGKTSLMLVPEIALTPQMVNRFKGRFKGQVAVLHSGLSDSEKYDEWRKIERKEAKIVVGARSSVFAPVDNIGLIIIDEEHEDSYKQSDNPRYHARDVAIWRGEYHQAPVVLGSATPSLESRARALKGVYHLAKLTKRPTGLTLPSVEVTDMRQEIQAGNRSNFSNRLLTGIRERIKRNEQVVLLLNRRGYSSFILCRDCGFVLGCPNCDISLTLHMHSRSMKCHYCGHEEPIPTTCPKCQSSSIRYYGTGTQKIEEELNELIPESKIIRMDIDTTRKKGAHQQLLKRFANQEANILLGTQMIAKGLDFPNVTLVGVLNADTALGLPDFRSAERTFQLLTQVSGRAGRADKPGEVIIQSFNPNHYSIQLAKDHDYESFFKKEMKLRYLSNYSPYYYMVKILVSHEKELVAAKKMGEIVNFIKPNLSSKAIVLGPTPRSLARTHNRYHFQTIIKYKNEANLSQVLHQVLRQSQVDQARGLFISIDSKPMNFI